MQLLFAEKIAQEKGIVITGEAKVSSAAMSAWIESNLGTERSKRCRKPGHRRQNPRCLNGGDQRRGPEDAHLMPLPLHQCLLWND